MSLARTDAKLHSVVSFAHSGKLRQTRKHITQSAQGITEPLNLLHLPRRVAMSASSTAWPARGRSKCQKQDEPPTSVGVRLGWA